jgi:hypothetical protein
MPISGYQALTIPERAYKRFHELQKLLVSKGVDTLPKDLLPPDFDGGRLTAGVLIEIAVRAIEKTMKTQVR